MTVFYSLKMLGPATNGSRSPEKPWFVVEAWRANGIPLEIEEPLAATVEDFALAHDRTHVEEILSLKKANGFGTIDQRITESLPYTTGAMIGAGRWALQNRSAAAAPCSGFHHAGHAQASLYCTFNGLMVTACRLRAEGLLRKVAILDCDQHFGNGTDDIIRLQEAESWVSHITTTKGYNNDATFLRRLPGIVKTFQGCDLVLYQAGADPHIDDPCGGYLTTEELRERDAIVFSTCRELNLPIAWNLAGGYQPDISKVVAIHVNTARECVNYFGAT